MRILVACDDEALRARHVEALQRLELTAAGSCSLARLALDVRTAQPDVVLVDGVRTAEEARIALERARRALDEQPGRRPERPGQRLGQRLGGLLLLPEGAAWLRVPLPLDVRPAVVLPSDGLDDAALRRGLERLRVEARVPSGSVTRYGVSLDARTREARANDLRVILTMEEAALLTAMMEQPSRVLRIEDLAGALFGRPSTDPRARAAVHSHVASLRARLAALQVGDQLEPLRDLGYRFVERKGRPRPPR